MVWLLLLVMFSQNLTFCLDSSVHLKFHTSQLESHYLGSGAQPLAHGLDLAPAVTGYGPWHREQ